MRALAVYQLKGGVGKTTTAVNLAALAARDGIRTLIWDLDPQGAASWLLTDESAPAQDGFWKDHQPLSDCIRHTRIPKLDVLVADHSLRKFHQRLASKKDAEQRMRSALDMLAETYGLVILDCAPVMTPQMEGILKACDRILLPVEPSVLSIRAYEQIRHDFDWVKKKQWLPFVTMIDRRKADHVRWVNDELKAYPEFLRTFIAYSASAERMLVERNPVVEGHPAVPLARNYRVLWQAVKPLLELR
ncbi:ParA family protein [Thalassolituus sp. LLYu03]|uniref:ParA family protein n=1 Tax=Thalassolituus sp. LLYu03 TaxID=3421656 RepID=UPI003D290C14